MPQQTGGTRSRTVLVSTGALVVDGVAGCVASGQVHYRQVECHRISAHSTLCHCSGPSFQGF